MFKSIALSAALAIAVSTPVAAGNNDAKLNYDTKKVGKTVEFRGHYGKDWTPKEVRGFINDDCKPYKKKVISFAVGKVHKRKGTAFLAVCS